jgi:DNA-binding transcriptional LysR family regulator
MKLNDVDLNKLHVFRVVAESLSLRVAGEHLLRTPSALSQSVSGLERELGFALFTRDRGRLKLTAQGSEVFRQVKSNERELEATLDRLRGEPATVRGVAQLGLPPGFPSVSTSSELARFLERYPALQLRLRFLPQAELAAELKAGRLDVAVSLQPLPRFSGLHAQALREEALVLVLPPRLRSLASEKPAQLPVVDYYQRPSLIDGWLRHHRLGVKKPAPARVRVYAANLDHVLQLVREQVGCAVVPRHVVEGELASGALIEHDLDRRRPWKAGTWLSAAKKPIALSPVARLLWQALAGN